MLTTVDYRSPQAAEQFVRSLRETGFGVLTNHPLQQHWVDDIYQAWQGFFAQPLEEKMHYVYDPQRFDGFFPTHDAETAKGNTVKDLKEYFHFYPWGRCPDALRAGVAAYYQNAMQLAAELLTWVERYTPTNVAVHYTEPLSHMIHASEQTLLRVLHYPPLQGSETPSAIRAAAHEDINLLTILPASNEPGLQVKTKTGEWFNVPCDFGHLIVNIGDMLQEVSQGYFPSTTHRVMNPIGADMAKSRISLPLFLHPRPEVVLSERYTARSYLQERLQELRGKGSPSPDPLKM